MPEDEATTPHSACSAEVRRLNRIISALMDRAERSTSVQASDFGLFQNTIMLEEQIRARTSTLEAVLRENEKMTRELRDSEAKFRGLVSQSLIGIVLFEDGRFSYSNAKFNDMFGYSAAEISALDPLELVAEKDRAVAAEILSGGRADKQDAAFRGRRKNGDAVDVESHISPMSVGTRSMLIGLFLDISDRTRAAKKVDVLRELLREESTHDSLTGLFNRRYLDESFAQALAAADAGGYPVSIIMSDLDHFKSINDTYGHLAGDTILRICGDVMRQHSRENDICCRYGGEEFLLVLPRAPLQVALNRAEQLRHTLATTTVVQDSTEVRATASFGIAVFPTHGHTRDELIASADNALYAAKAGGRNRVEVGALPTEATAAEAGTQAR